MSINSVRKFIESSGCGWIVGGVIALLMVVSMSSSQCSRANRLGDAAQDGQAPKEKAIVTVGSSSITAPEVENAATEQQSKYEKQNLDQGNLDPVPTVQIAQLYASALYGKVMTLIEGEIAAGQGIKVTDEDIKTAVNQQVDADVAQLKAQLVQQGALKADCTPADIDKFLVSKNQGTVAEIKANLLKEVSAKPEARSQIAAHNLQQKIASELKFTDDELKLARAEVKVKRIFVAKDASAKEDPKKAIEKAEADVKGGKPFVEVAKAVSAASSSSASNAGSDLDFSMADAFADPKFASLKQAKVGFITPIIDLPQGYAIYQVSSIKPYESKDWAKEKPMVQAQVTSSIAQLKVAKLIEDYESSDKLKWSNKAYEALYTVAKAGMMSADDRNAKLKPIADGAITGTDAGDARPLAFARYIASTFIYNLLPAAEREKDAERDKRLTVLAEFTKVSEGADIRIEMARLLAAKKDAAAVESLTIAASAISTNFGPSGDGFARQIGDIMAQLTKDRLITDEQIKAVNDALDAHKKNKEDYAADLKRQADERKAAEDATKKEQAESEAAEKAAKANAPKAPAGPSVKDLTAPAKK